MANEDHLAVLRKGVTEWNHWIRQGDPLGRVLITNLHGADLSGANLSGINLRGAGLNTTDLSGADLSGADLSSTDLTWTFLSGANLRGANLEEARFWRTGLAGTDFSKAVIGSTVFSEVDLSLVKGLDTVEHTGPSTIGLDTLQTSGGKIPDAFLRGAGVSDTFIAYISSLVSNPIEFYSCFISYSTNDQDFADRLYADLQASGVRCWFAPHDMSAGKKLNEQIDEAIRLHDRLLLILSSASITSEWVQTEIAKARKREAREKRRVLFPIRLVDFEVLREWECFDADRGKDSAREIREYFIPDFSQWKEFDSYRLAFERLLRDLKAGSIP